MNRKDFISRSLFASAAFAVSPSLANQKQAFATFKMNYAPHEGMFRNHSGNDFIQQIQFMHEQGFRSIEDNDLLKRSTADQDKIGRTSQNLV